MARLRRPAAVLLAALATLSAGAQESAPPAPPPAPAPTPAPSAGAPPPPADLIAVAEAEALREKQSVVARVRQLLNELAASADPDLGLVKSRIDELVAIGEVAVPLLLQAIDHEDATPGAWNSGAHASRAAARIGGPKLRAELERLVREGHPAGRSHAARALGLLGDPAALPALELALADADPRVVRQVVLSLGALGGSTAIELLLPRVTSQDPELASAAISALREAGAGGHGEVILARLAAEHAKPITSEAVIRAALDFFAEHPREDAVAEMQRPLRAGNTSPALSSSAIQALLAAAGRFESAKKPALEALRWALASPARSVVREAAHALHALGDDSGIKSVTALLDADLNRNPNSFNSRYLRGEILLEFGKWREAQRDFREGLKAEKEPRDPQRVYLGLARASAGLGRFSDAARYLQRLPEARVEGLDKVYPEFESMAADSRWADLFEAS